MPLPGRRTFASWLAPALLVLAACGPRWTVLAQANPDPLIAAQRMVVEPIHYDPPMVGAKYEAEYLADKSPDQRDSWQIDKADTSSRYAAAVMSTVTDPPSVHTLQFVAAPAPGVFLVRPIVSFIEPGFYGGIVAAPTIVRMRVQILASDGAVLDDFAVQSVIGASILNPASGTRMRMAGEDLGRVTGDYIRRRVAGF